jgi:fimbrial chaperone protein
MAALFALALHLFAGGSAAMAGSFRAAPVILDVGTGHSNSSLTLANNVDRPVTLQVRAYRWTQVDGRDVYTLAPDLIASPPIFTLAGRAAQLLRVGARTGPLAGAYRIMVQEVAEPAAAREQIAMLLRLNLPLYAYDRRAKPQLSWSAWRETDGQLVVQARNDGGTYSEILHIAVGPAGAAGRPLAETDLMGVVLPSGSRRWALGRVTSLAAAPDLDLISRDVNGAVRSHRVHVDQR